jgi:hypothetical protein
VRWLSVKKLWLVMLIADMGEQCVIMLVVLNRCMLSILCYESVLPRPQDLIGCVHQYHTPQPTPVCQGMLGLMPCSFDSPVCRHGTFLLDSATQSTRVLIN